MKESFKYLKYPGLILLFCFCMPAIWAQNVQVTGTVYDKSQETVIGASVVVKGTTIGTITDIDGKFTLPNVPANATLQISYVGYKTREIPLNGQTTFVITLEDDTQLLDELVVVGYGVMRKSDLTGAVGSVKANEALRNTPTSNITNALQGRLAGVSITSGTGDPNSSSTIRVRGVISLEGDMGPLVVVDGVPSGTSLNTINPSDVESVEVLKDASATAVYGSKGANGVILVTTKNPTVGKVNIEYNGYANFKSPIRLPDMLSPVEFADLANAYGREFTASAGQAEKIYYTPEQIDGFRRGEGTFDYMDNVFRDTSIEHTHELSISGGSEKTRFLFSGSYTDNNGIAYNSNAKRVNYRLKVDTEVFKWLKAGFNFFGDYSKSYGPRFSQYNGLLIHALTFPNTIQPRVDEYGDYNNTNLIGPQYNPMLFVNEIHKDNGYQNNNRLQAYVEVELLKGLTFRMTQAFNFDNRISRNTMGKYSYDYYQNYANKTAAEVTNTDGNSWVNINTLSYIKEFNKNHRINATAVFEQQETNSFKNFSRGVDLLSSIIGSNNTGSAKTVTANSDRSRTTMMSYLLRANYALMNRYFVTASWRRDGSSRLFYSENTWEDFTSMALAWTISEEKFMKNLTFIDQLKLRFSYGESGNQNAPLYIGYNQITSTFDWANNPAYRLKPGNSNIRWEKSTEYNGGLDLSLFNNRLSFNLNVFEKNSKYIIAKIKTPLYTGLEDNTGNGASIQNKGFDITIGAIPVMEKDFTWDTNLTMWKVNSIIKDLPDNQEWMDMSGNYEVKYYRNIKGEKIATMYGYVNEGVWTSEEVAAGLAPTGIEAGAYKYADFDGVPGTGPDDRQPIGNGLPSFQWGWDNTFTYKDFDLGLSVIGVHGFDIYNYTREARLSVGSNFSLGPNPEWQNRWIAGTNENTSIAGFIKNPNALTPSSQYVEKGDFVKIKSITLGYTFPKSVLSKLYMSKLRLYASIQNPFLITKYSGIDPEVTLKSPITSGIDWGYYPNGRNILVGLNVTF